MGDRDAGFAERLLEQFRAGDRRALARAISIVEDQRAGFEEMLHALHPAVGRAQRIGITGPPGAGKSTLTSEIASAFRQLDRSVGIVAVDPSSPRTGGALLGDRVRMLRHSGDAGVFIRSMASRGAAGGLAMASREIADLLDVFGYEVVITESVGVGQADVAISEVADTTVVVLVPESGDSIQALKAGLMEVADIFVVNKADRAGAGRMVRDLEQMLAIRGEVRGDESIGDTSHWSVPVLSTEAHEGKGVDQLLDALVRHGDHLVTSGDLARRRRRRYASRTRAIAEREMRRRLWSADREQFLADGLADVETGMESPYSLARRILENVLHPER